MFSSLEALDADDTVNAAPVVRQGAFQPKAKPRARKGGSSLVGKPSSLPSASAPIAMHETRSIRDADVTEGGGSAHVDAASSPVITGDVCEGRNSPVKSANVSESAVKDVVEPQVSIASSQKNSSRNVNGPAQALSEGDGMAPLTTVLHDDAPSAFEELLASHSFKPEQSTVLHDAAPSAFEELLASHSLKPEQSTRKKHEPRRQIHSQTDKVGVPPEVAREESLSQQSLYSSDVLGPSTIGIDSHESEAVAPSKHMDNTQTENLDESLLDFNEEFLVEQSADAMVVEKPIETNIKRVKKKKTGYDQTKADHGNAAALDGNSNLLDETIKPKKAKFAIFDESVAASASQAEESANKAKNAKGCSQEADMQNPIEHVKKKKKKKKPETSQSKELPEDGEKVATFTVNEATSKEGKKAKRAAIFTAAASASASQPRAEAANEGNCTMENVQEASVRDAIEIAKRKKSRGKDAVGNDQEALVSNSVEIAKRKKMSGDDAKEHQDIPESAPPQTAPTSCSRATNKRATKKPARFDDCTDDDLIRAITQEPLEPSEKRKREARNQIYTEEDNTDNDFLITYVQGKTKGKKSMFASFSASTFQPDTIAEEDGVGKSAAENGISSSPPPADEKAQKKKFKKSLPSRRRVERRVMNPANPDLDPKKMTMKDIIRLAEAKEKMLKEGESKKPKEGNKPPASEFEKEDDNLESSCLAPQVQIIDGRIVINQESLVVNAHPKDDIRTYTRVEETHSKLNYHSYMRRTPKMKWKKDETELFYEALREFGTNFAMIQHLFPGRTRKQVLLKYKKEEKLCPLRISEAMRVKPCETLHFTELLTSMNLLPSKMPDAIEGLVDPFDDRTFSTEEVEDGNRLFAGAEGRVVDGNSKLEELSTQNEGGEKRVLDGSNPWNSEAALMVLEPEEKQREDFTPKADEMTKPPESPTNKPVSPTNKAASPPRKKKSLFSYQTAATKS